MNNFYSSFYRRRSETDRWESSGSISISTDLSTNCSPKYCWRRTSGIKGSLIYLLDAIPFGFVFSWLYNSSTILSANQSDKRGRTDLKKVPCTLTEILTIRIGSSVLGLIEVFSSFMVNYIVLLRRRRRLSYAVRQSNVWA